MKVDVELRFVSIETGKDLRPALSKKDVTIIANGTTVVISGEIDNTRDEPHVLAARIMQGGVCISRDADWPQPFKYLSFTGRGVKVEASSGKYVVSAERPTKGLVFEEVDGRVLGDNCLDVIPGDDQVVEFSGGDAGSPKYRYLGSDEA